jgi:hypothetical protein
MFRRPRKESSDKYMRRRSQQDGSRASNIVLDDTGIGEGSGEIGADFRGKTSRLDLQESPEASLTI